MEDRMEKSKLVLKYAKRRFDGGSEIELIEAIERQQARIRKVDKPGEPGKSLLEANIKDIKTLEDAPASVLKANKQETWGLLHGPMALCIGVVGMLTALLAMATFKRVDNPLMLRQSREVFDACRKTFCQGLSLTVKLPVRCFRIKASAAA